MAAPPPPPSTPFPPYNAWEIALASEVASLRRNPAAYAQLLESERKPLYRGKDLVLKGQRRKDDVIIETREGRSPFSIRSWSSVAACNEAIAALRATQPLPALRLEPGLSIACKAVVNVNGPAGQVDTNTVVKMREYGGLTPGGTAIEVSAYGGKDARAMLMNLLISDGDADRAQRKDLLEPHWTTYGLAVGKHASYDHMALLLFTTQFNIKQEVAQNLPKYKHLWTSTNEP